ncbi:hypothetical protein ACFFSH_31790 [Streptomyces filamentosus]|uniref:Uncharacterized protein n=1 Tax=Streptomyces filamentosus TaxID=67294 RepID=A0A919BSM0_STRFL|nr:hypothetical protein [Streptomyces filamentosus]GHG13537.1 hypothetical protein GCM10017667_54330 [Streptomyces filamentosus]
MARTPRPRPADQAQVRLTPQDLEKLKAVVLDANAYGHARPDLDQLGRWAQRLAGMGVETWVPEPVAWEWAEHLASDWQVLKGAARNERKRLQSAGLDIPAPAGYATRDDVITAVLENLAKIPNVKIIKLTGRSAIEGLKDQVLLRPPAKRKGAKDPAEAIKTGASDSAWLRDILELADPDEVLIVTSDGDVRAAFEAWKKPVPNLRKLEELRPTLFDLSVDDGHARSAIIRYLTARLPADQQDEDALDIGRIVGLEAAFTRKLEEEDTGLSPSSYGASVTGLVALAGIGVVHVEAGESAKQALPDRRREPTDPGTVNRETADAMVFFLATGEATIQRLLHGGDPEVAVVPISNVLVRANLTFQFADGVIVSMSADTDATAILLERAFDESDEAETDLIDALNTVPGIVLEDGVLGDRQRFGIPGTSAHVVIDVTRDGEDWTAEINLWHGNDEEDLVGTIGVECEYNADTWWGGSRDGFQGPDAYPIAVYGDELHERHGIWSLPAWLIEHITWPRFPALAAEMQPATAEDEPTDT